MLYILKRVKSHSITLIRFLLSLISLKLTTVKPIDKVHVKKTDQLIQVMLFQKEINDVHTSFKKIRASLN